MNFQQTILALIIGLFVAFSAGIYVGRGDRQPVSTIPSNLDVAAVMASEKAARAESAAYLQLLTTQTQAIATCGKRDDQQGAAH